MNTKHRKTQAAIFQDPVNSNLEWNKIESLFVAVGCRVIEGSGSSVTFEKDGVRAYFHRPHPEKEAFKYRIKAAREFLIKIGVTP
ncbi:type II toxin-antitoxin system HicA family toxin [Desulfobacter postgatei]|uniref:type II toxin-antitoxin system HicA family toxin n=1 Tax=Desulfobacter postgatei TaxID=2293 RepID=UPI00259AFADC|nr:type II toxin-antitoxin system HicA family toxin [uncultured Desulfobacter sp.]